MANHNPPNGGETASAEELRAAVAKLRETAKNTTPGPWEVRPGNGVSSKQRPVVIDPSRLPGQHTKTQEWWDRFVPPWMTATVQDDGTVHVVAAVHYRHFPDEPESWAPSDPASVRRRMKNVREWFARGVPQVMRDAVVSGVDGTTGGAP